MTQIILQIYLIIGQKLVTVINLVHHLFFLLNHSKFLVYLKCLSLNVLIILSLSRFLISEYLFELFVLPDQKMIKIMYIASQLFIIDQIVYFLNVQPESNFRILNSNLSCFICKLYCFENYTLDFLFRLRLVKYQLLYFSFC